MDALNSYRLSLAHWLQYPLPVLTEDSTECERLWGSFLQDRRLALQAVSV